MFPTSNQLLQNFSSCFSWEEKYLYIIELSKLLPKLPNNLCLPQYFITSCQSYTWVALLVSDFKENQNSPIKFYGNSDSDIIKGIIVIIFSLYQNLDIKSIIDFNAESFLNKLQLSQNLTVSRSNGVHAILNSIRNQANNFLLKIKN